MNRYDRAEIDQIIAKLEKINDFTELYDDCIGTLLVEINELKDSVDERVESVSDYGISQTENNQQNPQKPLFRGFRSRPPSSQRLFRNTRTSVTLHPVASRFSIAGLRKF